MAVINSLDVLYPPFADKLVRFNKLIADNNIGAYPYETLRTFEQQLEYYKQGRELKNGVWVIVDAKKIVTKSMPGTSWHNFGVAVDYVFDGDKSKQGIQWSWNDKLPWKELGRLGQMVGLEWAGTWLNFPEMPHFQCKYGLKVNQAYEVLVNEGLPAVWKLFDKSKKY